MAERFWWLILLGGCAVTTTAKIDKTWHAGADPLDGLRTTAEINLTYTR